MGIKRGKDDLELILMSKKPTELSKITDMNGEELKARQIVNVHQEDQVSTAWIVDTFAEDPSPTVNEAGWWVDINKGEGVEGMPSYILEVLPRPPKKGDLTKAHVPITTLRMEA
jgi:hypothetical protein